MKRFWFALAAISLSLSAAQAQSMNKEGDAKQTSPGTTGAMGNASNGGVATDPGGVQAQQGDSAKSSPGTVGAAPMADTPSQTPKH
jgi:hypothetical protein